MLSAPTLSVGDSFLSVETVAMLTRNSTSVLCRPTPKLVASGHAHDMRTIAIDDSVAWVSVSLSVTWATSLAQSPDGATRCGNYYITVVCSQLYGVTRCLSRCITVCSSREVVSSTLPCAPVAQRGVTA